jgi:hypothetical protein
MSAEDEHVSQETVLETMKGVEHETNEIKRPRSNSIIDEENTRNRMDCSKTFEIMQQQQQHFQEE